jgi:hydrogenase nickel incorporation protein HypB
LLERTIRRASGPKPFVIEGDQATDRDAERIRRAGATAIQINTGTGCHLDAAMVQKALAELAPPRGTLVFVENVGNLVCPALFDLGEHAKVVIVSVAEGDDKPLKYPHMILASDLLIVQKLDLLPHVSFDVELCISNARRVKAALPAIALSARSGQGMASWYDWLATRHEEVERA